MINAKKFRDYLDTIKSFFKEYRTFKEVKSKIIITNGEIRVNNIDVQKILNKSRFSEYLTTLTKKNSTNKIIFNYCNINDIKLKINTNLVFVNCEVANLTIHQDKFYSSKFEECTFNFCQNSEKLLVNSSRIDIKNCVVEINKNKNSIFRLGELNNSVVNIQNLDFINTYTKHFKIQIVSKDISLNNYISKNGIELQIDNTDKSINSIYMRNSVLTFNPNYVVDAKIMLIEDSSINNLTLESESIELCGQNQFNHVTILNCNDISISEDSNLLLKDTIIKSKLLECLDNSEINDETNRLKWLTGISKINVGKHFKLKYKGTTIYEKISQDYSKNDNEEIVEIIKRERRIR